MCIYTEIKYAITLLSNCDNYTYHVYAFSATISDEDISEVIEQLPPVLLSPEITRNLLHNLPSKMVSHQMNLKETLQHCHRYNFSLSLENIVEALMLTRGLGRYVTSLMPFRMSLNVNSLHMYYSLCCKPGNIHGFYKPQNLYTL